MYYNILKQSFLGCEFNKDTTYIIIGGGVTALVLGFYMKKSGLSFKIVEKSGRVGGLLGTVHLPSGPAERAANGFIWCRELQDIADELGLKIQSPKPSARARFLVRDKKLRRWPLTIAETFSLVARMLRNSSPRLETVEDFGLHYFGKTFTRQVLEPGFAGVYGADISQLSFPGALSRVAEWMGLSNNLPLAVWRGLRKKPSGNRQKRASGTHSFDGGMGAFVERLGQYLEPEIECGVDGLSLKEEPGSMIITTPAYVAKDFFSGRLSQLLDAVAYTPLITTTVFLEKSAVARFKEGFGCLIPRSEPLNLLGVLFNSCIFDGRVKDDNHLSLTCMMRDDTSDGQLLSKEDDDILAIVWEDLDTLFSLKGPFLDAVIHRWPHAIPVYTPSLYGSWFEMDEILTQHHPNRNLFGNYTGEISIRGICQTAARVVKGSSSSP